MTLYEKIALKAETNEILYHAGKAVQHTLLTLKYYYTRRASASKIKKYLRTHTTCKLHIGAGLKLLGRGWANTDCTLNFPANIHLDVTRRFPVADAVFDFVYTEHLIEHLTREQADHMLCECYRILKPGGVLRVVCPDLDKFYSCEEINAIMHNWGIGLSMTGKCWVIQ